MSNIQYVGMTVANMEQSIKFYTEVLSFQKIKDLEVAGDDWSKLQGIFGLRMRVVQMQLGEEMIVLMEYLTPQGRPIPVDSRSNDRWFQHIAIAVKDMDKAYQHLRQYNVKHTSTSPQTLPGNLKSAGVEAFYFKDPDGHNLELITFPPDKGDPKWLQQTDKLFLGIDHSAVGVKDAQASFGLYRDRLKLELAAEVENYGSEFEHVTCVFSSRVHVNSLKGSEGIGFELLEYIAPTDGKSMPVDSRACDLWHYQTVISVDDLVSLEQELRSAPCQFISPGIVKMSSNQLGFSQALSIRDLDGHVLHLVN
ncbi:MAG: glyoxalase [Pleurocapsa sp. SU_5_0]|nr:glyoxalase [Pleurocapsa sp. SU_5_0]NJO97753.1 glyoxalase [Pleurocapsa sp. CRU_1_2]NJR45422.1 glyoxalase [Hyellaceae cyanobacterium CSU_1_1]